MKKTDFDYSQAMTELEGILAALQSNDISIDRAIALHVHGKKLVGELEAYLQQAEVVVKKQVAGAQ